MISRFITVLKQPIIAILLLVLAGCNGGSGENGTNPFPTTGTSQISLTLSIKDEACSADTNSRVEQGSSFCLYAELNDNGSPISNGTVAFTATAGILSSPSRLTDTNGIAQVTVTTTDAALGVAEATATYGDTSSSSSFEIIASTSVTPEPPAIALALLDSDCVNVLDKSIDQGTSFCMQATLTENSAPVVDTRIDFTATIGTLALESRLTDSNGIAQVVVSTIDSVLGAAEATASASNFNISTNLSYEVLQAADTNLGKPSITLALKQNETAVNRFKAGGEARFEAVVKDSDGNPLNVRIVSFTAERGTLSTDSSLTDENGVAGMKITATDADLGAAIATAQVALDEGTFTSAINYEILTADALEENFVRAGHFNDQGEFIEDILGVSLEDANGNVTISAGATLGVSLALIDENNQRVTTPTPVTFTSNCVSNNLATIDEQTLTINGVASATFEDSSCAGSTGNKDQIVASVTINNSTVSLAREVNIEPENIGAIQFLSAEPDNIVLLGTGGQGKESISTLTFQVNGVLGNPLSQKQVGFALNTEVGNLSLDPLSGLTNSQGQISTRVTAGNVPTAVRVTATTTTESGTEIQTQSDLLTVNTGLPDQNSFSIASSNLNPEAANINGQIETITVWLADNFNNPVPDGTAVSFTTEGGQIVGNCVTENGRCFVNWESTSLVPDDHRITILATAIGHETFFDTNGNNVFDTTTDGPSVDDGNSDGLAISDYRSSGFIDMSEAWRDDNENRIYDVGETFIDYDNDNVFDARDTRFNGPQCEGAACGTGINQTISVRRSLVMIMSSSTANWDVYNGTTRIASSNSAKSVAPLTLANGAEAQLTLVFSDTAGEVMPSGTQVGSLDANGNIISTIFTVNNTNRFAQSSNGLSDNGHTISGFTEITNNNAGPQSDTQTVNFAIQAPSSARTIVNFNVTLSPP